jgi:site-specific recombinase XerC
MPSTAATNALDHQADIAKVQEWLGHANKATTRIYDHQRDVQGRLLTQRFTTCGLGHLIWALCEF